MSFEYTSVDATDSGQCSNAECPDPVVSSFPPNGSGIAVPTYVTLSSDVEDAIIRYTTDGTTPDVLSAIYTGPILVTNVQTQIKAIAYVEDCTPAGVVFTAAYTNPPFPFIFSYACDTPDHAGQWGGFAPNGTSDWHWQFQFTLTGATTIKRLELYQLGAAGNWTTGQVWSTDSPITTPLETANPFSCFPLLVFIAAVQQYVAYQSSLGSFGAGTYTWDLYGDQAYPAPSNNFFRLDIILGDDTRLTQTIGTTCTAAPPICAAPAVPTLTPTCGSGGFPAIDVTFTVLLGRSWILYRADGSGEFGQIASGTGTGGVQTVTDGGLVEGETYYYYISVDLAGCGFKDSNTAITVALIYATVSISSDKIIVDPGESFTLSWNSNQLYTAVCNGCLAGQLKTPFGCKPGNTSGSQSTSEAVCGIYTYEVSGCNPCGTVVDSVQVEVRCVATCGGANPAIVTSSNPTDFACACSAGNRCGSVWTGQWTRQGGVESCLYIIAGGDTQTVIGGCLQPDLPCGLPVMGTLQFNSFTNRWTIQIRHPVEPVIYFEGEKLYGSDATGTYTKTGGCSTLGSLTVT